MGFVKKCKASILGLDDDVESEAIEVQKKWSFVQKCALKFRKMLTTLNVNQRRKVSILKSGVDVLEKNEKAESPLTTKSDALEGGEGPARIQTSRDVWSEEMQCPIVNSKKLSDLSLQGESVKAQIEDWEGLSCSHPLTKIKERHHAACAAASVN